MASQEQQESPLRLAEILSDLVSLRVCVHPFPFPHHHPTTNLTHKQDPAAALALVSARPHDQSSPTGATTNQEDDDEDIKRAKDLLKYHYDVKEKHKRGELSLGLERARREVERAVGRA
jgi:hypothetical protein